MLPKNQRFIDINRYIVLVISAFRWRVHERADSDLVQIENHVGECICFRDGVCENEEYVESTSCCDASHEGRLATNERVTCL